MFDLGFADDGRVGVLRWSGDGGDIVVKKFRRGECASSTVLELFFVRDTRRYVLSSPHLPFFFCPFKY